MARMVTTKRVMVSSAAAWLFVRAGRGEEDAGPCLLPAPWTAPATVETAKAIYAAVGQVPIVVKREIEGFILNRLQAVLLSEAFRLVEDGYVTPQDLDEAATMIGAIEFGIK